MQRKASHAPDRVRIRTARLHLGLLGSTLACATGAQAQREPESHRPQGDAPAIAFTFDDIPAHGPLPPGVSRVYVIRGITEALTAARVPAFGFLNAGFGLDDPKAPEAVAAWRKAGMPLGNHGYSHGNLDTVGADAFPADVIRNEAPLAAAAGRGASWHWFRYPFLAEGRDPAVRDSVRKILHVRGYKAAAVTLGFGDFLWNPIYTACAAKRDTAASRSARGPVPMIRSN